MQACFPRWQRTGYRGVSPTRRAPPPQYPAIGTSRGRTVVVRRGGSIVRGVPLYGRGWALWCARSRLLRQEPAGYELGHGGACTVQVNGWCFSRSSERKEQLPSSIETFHETNMDVVHCFVWRSGVATSNKSFSSTAKTEASRGAAFIDHTHSKRTVASS